MKVKFIKEYLHLEKDTILTVDNASAIRLIALGVAEETKETPKPKKKVATPKKKVVKKVIENECKGCGETDEPCDDCNDKK